MEEKVRVVDEYTKKLKSSGYSQEQCREFIVSGIKGFKNKQKNRQKEGKGFYRKDKDTLSLRVKKKLVEKTSWYRGRERKSGLERDYETDDKRKRRRMEPAEARAQVEETEG